MNRLMLVVVMAMGMTGCASSGPAGLPGGAALVQEGNPPLMFKATEKGQLYVRDASADRVVYDIALEPGQTVTLDEKSGRVLVDGKAAEHVSVRSYSGYQLFFKGAGKREYHPAYNP